jgi:ubiquinone/menaquinone biosynthesis C-methylase UbiE
MGQVLQSSHRASVAELIEATSPGDELLDAACATGKYWPVLGESWQAHLRIDQSAGMLALGQRDIP